jgi:AraC family transcriptional activator of pobA
MIQGTPVYNICSISGHGQNEIFVNRFASYLNEHRNLSAAHRHSFYHLIFFTKGGGSHTIDFESFDVKPYQIYFMIPGQVHSWNFDGFTDGFVINFSASFFNSFLLNQVQPEDFSFFNGDAKKSVINLPDYLHQKTESLFDDIYDEYERPAIHQKEMLRLLMLQLFIIVERQNVSAQSAEPASYSQTLLRNFQKLLEANFTLLKLPKDYAELLFITPNHLNSVCKAILGMQAGEVIRNRILLEAKRLLINPQLNITQITFQLNFNDNSYFTKFFKKFENITPEEFRKKILKSNHHE